MKITEKPEKEFSVVINHGIGESPIELTESDIKQLLIRYKIMLAMLAKTNLYEIDESKIYDQFLMVEVMAEFANLSELNEELLEKSYKQFKLINDPLTKLAVQHNIGDYPEHYE
jgi:hypothetical protein